MVAEAVVAVGLGADNAIDERRRASRAHGDERPVASQMLIPEVERPWVAHLFKRSVDVVGASIGLLILAPILSVVALLVAVTSRGPVIFRQTRVGRGGRMFTMYKFRTMIADAEALKAALAEYNEHATGPIFKMRHDPRITSVGRILRKFSIDELPQLINVLLGDMSLVGPRPPVPQEVARYRQWQVRRLSVKPGLTCIWQVSGRSRIGFEDWMRLDMRYIDGWSPSLDLKLIAKTFGVVLRGDGAY